jgi:transcriptional regulator with XRE-family HTH domain
MTVTITSWPVGEVLREARHRAGLTREKLATLAGCSYGWIAQLEAGAQPVNSTKLEGIWRVLDALGGRSSDGDGSPRRQDGAGGT